MGTSPHVDHERFPRQGSFLGRAALVCFNYDTGRTLRGEVVRGDAEAPWHTIIRLEDGRHVLGWECQWCLVGP